MDSREQLLYLLEKYYEGEYETPTFTDEFNRVYDLETDYSRLSSKEHKLFKALSIVTGRFSPFKEDLQIPNAYFSEKDVKNEAIKVYLQLQKNNET